MRVSVWLGALGCLLASCSSPRQLGGADCAQDGSCPSGLTCFPNWRCYAPTDDPPCEPACYGVEPFCDKRTLRCVACLDDAQCGDGTICSAPTQRCVPGCNAGHPSCGAGGGTCDVAAGVCRGCTSDAQCTTPGLGRCNDADGQCVACLPGADGCPSGQFCSATSAGYACAPGCKSVADCAVDGGAPSAAVDCCAGLCVDTTVSTDHCGGCGNVCRSGKSCCNGTCADLASDVDNCASCGNSCARPNVQGPACAGASCTDKGCEPYFADCDKDPKNGCEVNLTRDAKNCYACGNVCTALPHAEPSCTVTNCSLGPCLAGFGDCNHVQSDGCEIDLTSDNDHCGACPTACAAGQSCVAGKCA